MSFVEQENMLEMFEGMIKYIFKQVKGIDIREPLQRMSSAGRGDVELW